MSGEPPSQPACHTPADTTICYDTFWYHNFYQVIPEAKPGFFLDQNYGCTPLSVTLTPYTPLQKFVRFAKVSWGDGTIDTLSIQPGDSIPVMHHIYTRHGRYTVDLMLRNSAGCENSYSRSVQSGHYAHVKYDTLACPAQPILFRDSVRYFGDINSFWEMSHRRSDGREGYLWDFGDGHTDSVPRPKHTYKSAGLYHARMITFDSLGCFDTVYFKVRLRGADAGIKPPKTQYLCSEILQLFDTSRLIDPLQHDKIYSYTWDFGDGSFKSNLKDPWHFYSTYGQFWVKLTVTSSRGCEDTDSVLLNIRGPEPLFRFVTDSVGCVPLEVEMENISRSTRNWIWYFGDPAHTTFPTDSNKNVKFIYTKPGVYYLHLYGGDSVYNASTGNWQYCASTWPDSSKAFAPKKKVVVLPYPKVDFTLPDSVCVGRIFTVTEKCDPKYDYYRWDFGDKVKGGYSPTEIHHYLDTGWYTVRLNPTYSPDGSDKECFDSAAKNIRVIDVKAAFEVDTQASRFSTFHFVNRSTNAVRYEWDFGQPSSGQRNFSRQKNPSHNYAPAKGVYKVCLKAFNELDCYDTFCLYVENTFETRIFIPNVITLGNSDQLNDEFDIDVAGEEKYDLTIVNRWGQTVFKSNTDAEPGQGLNWNGTVLNKGEVCPAGVYYVIFRYNFYFEDAQEYHGTLTIIR